LSKIVALVAKANFQPTEGLLLQLRNISFSDPKTRKIRQLMNIRKGNIELCWGPGHAGITGNEKADEEAKRSLEESIPKDKMPILKRMD
jgi:hypothetical protein